MAINEILQRVERRLEAVELTPRAASLRAGLSGDAIRNLQRAVGTGAVGRKGVTGRTITALAPVLRTSTDWLLTGQGDEEVRDGATDTVAVVGYVGAGAVATLYSEGQGPFDFVEAPRQRTEHTVALEIRGASLGPAFDDGLVFYDDVRSPITPDLHGRLCVVGLLDGRVLVKILRPAREEGRYHLLSNSTEEAPLRDEEVLWAARVKEVRPR